MTGQHAAVAERLPDASASPAPTDANLLQATIAETAIAAGDIGCHMADIAGTVDDVRRLAHSQTTRFASVGGEVSAIVAANERMRIEAHRTAETARGTRASVEQSLGAAVGQIESGLSAVGRSLGDAIEATNQIAQVAAQTRMVALNAAIQAAHAGSEGKSFAVVASAVRDLAEEIQTSSKTIAATLGELTATIRTLASTESSKSHTGKQAGLRESVDAALAQFREDFDGVARAIEELAQSAATNVAGCSRVDASVRSMAQEVSGLALSIDSAAKKSERLLGISERLIEVTANSGALTDDTPFIDCAMEIGAEMSHLLSESVDTGRISVADLFDEKYEPIPGSAPQQHLTRFVNLTDRLFPALQESVLEWSDRVTFCAAVDRNGYLPTHNQKYSKPQRTDPEWNAANCRNRRLFQDRTGLAAGRNRKAFLVQTYRRDMGGGQFAILKEVDVPITVRDRHWGNIRLAFQPTRTI